MHCLHSEQILYYYVFTTVPPFALLSNPSPSFSLISLCFVSFFSGKFHTSFCYASSGSVRVSMAWDASYVNSLGDLGATWTMGTGPRLGI